MDGKGRAVGHKSSRSGSISSDTGRTDNATIEQLDIAHGLSLSQLISPYSIVPAAPTGFPMERGTLLATVVVTQVDLTVSCWVFEL